MQNGPFHSKPSTDQATPGEERAWGMRDVGYSFDAQMEDDAYLLPAVRKHRFTLVEAFMGLARRLTRQ